jgi:hypothetical protein
MLRIPLGSKLQVLPVVVQYVREKDITDYNIKGLLKN